MEKDDNGQQIDPRNSPSGSGEHHSGTGDVLRVAGVTPIPASIVKAMCKVQATIEAVKKTQRNLQGGYNFASTDDIYAALALKMGEVGLMILPLEMSPPTVKRVEKKDPKSGEIKVSQWGEFHFGFVLATAEATWFDERSSRSIFIQLLGPQTFNAAESYCQKQFLRSLFKLPTGDMDLDAMPQAETEEGQLALTGQGIKRKSSSAAKKDGTAEKFAEIRKAIADAPNADVLSQIPDLYADEIGTLPRAWVEIYEHEYEDRMEALRS
ncbi:MAG: ERF family protein [Pseudomonadota bacterium]